MPPPHHSFALKIAWSAQPPPACWRSSSLEQNFFALERKLLCSETSAPECRFCSGVESSLLMSGIRSGAPERFHQSVFTRSGAPAFSLACRTRKPPFSLHSSSVEYLQVAMWCDHKIEMLLATTCKLSSGATRASRVPRMHYTIGWCVNDTGKVVVGRGMLALWVQGSLWRPWRGRCADNTPRCARHPEEPQFQPEASGGHLSDCYAQAEGVKGQTGGALPRDFSGF